MEPDVWARFAVNPCAWTRIVSRTAPSMQQKTKGRFQVIPHAQIATKDNLVPVSQFPPVVVKGDRTTVRCAYCGSVFKSEADHARKCAPDAFSVLYG